MLQIQVYLSVAAKSQQTGETFSPHRTVDYDCRIFVLAILVALFFKTSWTNYEWALFSVKETWGVLPKVGPAQVHMSSWVMLLTAIAKDMLNYSEPNN